MPINGEKLKQYAVDAVKSHPDSLWVLPLLSGALMAYRAASEARKKSPWAVVYTLAAIWSLGRTADGVKQANVIAENKRGSERLKDDPNLTARIIQAIEKARAEGRLPPKKLD